MIVVTGGAGFIGSNILAGLEADGRTDLVVVDTLGSDDKWRNIAGRGLADVVRPDRLFNFLDARADAIEAVIHMGAISSTEERDSDVIVENNIRLTLDLTGWCARHGVRLIYASSAATYGDGALGFDDDAEPGALARLRPLNAYGWSKHMVDRRIVDLSRRGAALPPQWAGLKFFNVYGPNEYHKGGQRSVAHQVFERIRDGGEARLFRSHRPDYPHGGQLRDFVWIGDCVAVVRWLLDTPAASGLFNVGSGKARSFADMARAVYAAMNRQPEIEFVDMPVHLREKYQYFTEAKIDRLRQAGFTAPMTELEDGIAAYVRGHLQSDDPYI
ncbi:ADP-glyceromanno-heptose 6-epimerase [Tistrella bauzanensis]|uniref:ADP-glyceromanno-heptose 6-epimerase n=1 Tax=Tistrella TaxID=171436 RepID=UPI0031F63CBA